VQVSRLNAVTSSRAIIGLALALKAKGLFHCLKRHCHGRQFLYIRFAQKECHELPPLSVICAGRMRANQQPSNILKRGFATKHE
jgi:hypothetical protein